VEPPTVIWVAAAFALVAFVSLMLALGDREYSVTIGGDDPPTSAPAPVSGDEDGDGVETGDTDEETALARGCPGRASCAGGLPLARGV